MNCRSNDSRNRLLAVLSAGDRDLLAPSLEEVELDAHQILEAPNDPVSYVYFVERGMISVICDAKPNHRIEVGMVGYEGMTGSCIVLGDDRSINESFVQSAGLAMRISTAAFRDLMDASRTLSATLQGSQTALANGRGRLDQRLARWLLMWDDRIRSPSLMNSPPSCVCDGQASPTP